MTASPEATPPLSVIMPVHNAQSLVGEAASTFLRALAPAGGALVIVDDASTDATASVARHAGADVVRLEHQAGPYVARNEGWRRSAAEQFVFVDVRCRPTGSWPAPLLEALQRPGTAIAAGDVRAEPGASVASRAAAGLQPLSLTHGRASAFLPYAPTCHLATHRSVLEAVDGFRPVRGGGDVDFCWRVQLADLGSVAFAEEAVLRWLPRERLRDLLGQFRRYGENERRLQQAFASYGSRPTQPASLARVAAHEALAAVRSPAGRGARTRLAIAAARVANAWGYRRAELAPADELGPAAARHDP